MVSDSTSQNFATQGQFSSMSHLRFAFHDAFCQFIFHFRLSYMIFNLSVKHIYIINCQIRIYIVKLFNFKGWSVLLKSFSELLSFKTNLSYFDLKPFNGWTMPCQTMLIYHSASQINNNYEYSTTPYISVKNFYSRCYCISNECLTEFKWVHHVHHIWIHLLLMLTNPGDQYQEGIVCYHQSILTDSNIHLSDTWNMNLTCRQIQHIPICRRTD